MSLLHDLQMLVKGKVPFDQAERLIQPALKPSATAETGAERMRKDRQAWAALNGMEFESEFAREQRLSQWLGLDLAPPPDQADRED